jgi:hypothetical protein
MGAVLEDDVDDGQSFAVGHFGSRPIQRLADVLREKDEAALRERLHKEFGIEDPRCQTFFASFCFNSLIEIHSSTMEGIRGELFISVQHDQFVNSVPKDQLQDP